VVVTGPRLDGDVELTHLWVRYRHASLERIGALQVAAEAARCGELGAVELEAAERAAHKLAGVLGTFGFMRGTELAREAEAVLRGAPVDGDRLAVIATAMLDHLAEAGARQ
jgi:HPt (histidine-containing phosphotransfer) domain-containing protein